MRYTQYLSLHRHRAGSGLAVHLVHGVALQRRAPTATALGDSSGRLISASSPGRQRAARRARIRIRIRRVEGSPARR